jgi:NAD(P)-dependent dehydrogenase (short-subunit alcohol dehydrogenase family)
MSLRRSSTAKTAVAGRSQSKASEAIAHLKRDYPTASGTVEFLQIDLSDLTTIKKSADDFLLREQRLDVLTNNAGIGTPPAGSQSAQGHELQLATNCLDPFLFTQLLLPLLRKTAAASPPGSFRVTRAGSLTTEIYAPTGDVSMTDSGMLEMSSSHLN